MRFVSTRLSCSGTFFDIGSGEGANARELTERGHRVFSIDVDPEVGPPVEKFRGWHATSDIRDYDLKGSFDLIYDINTLCHVKNPPLEKIRSALKPNGFFFSIWPTALAPQYVEEGKSYTNRIDEMTFRQMLDPIFLITKIEAKSEPDFKGQQLSSWVAWARP